MIEHQDVAIIFYAHYIAAQVGATGLTVTVDVWEVQRDGTATEIVSGGSATEVGDGLYRYLLAAGSVDEPAEYIAVFKTADTTVSQRDIPAMWVIERAGVENLDASVNAVLTDTAEIGAAGAGLTALPWNAAWDAEVQSECADALTAFGIGAAVLAAVVENGKSVKDFLRIMKSALTGLSDGGGTATLTFQDDADSKARITATVDANGNRTAVTLDAS